MTYLYFGCLIVSIGVLFWLKLFDVRNSINQVLIFLCAVASNFGYYLVAVADDLGSAIVAQIYTYAGGMFLPALFLFLVMEVCHIKPHRVINITILIIQSVAFSFVCTIGKNDLFYKDMSISKVMGVTVLEKSYGPLHVVYPLTMVVYLAVAFFIIIHTFMVMSCHIISFADFRSIKL